jgi:hypothetical protein
MILTANRWPLSRCVADLTVQDAPEPIVSWMTYGPTKVSDMRRDRKAFEKSSTDRSRQRKKQEFLENEEVGQKERWDFRILDKGRMLGVWGVAVMS